MKKTFFTAFALLAQISTAQAALPNQFGIACADPTSSGAGTQGASPQSITARGSATAIPSNQLTGIWVGGFGYTVNLEMMDPVVFMTPQPVKAQFSCFFRPKLDRMMYCNSSLRELATVPGFTALSAQMPLPTIFGAGAGSLTNITVRFLRTTAVSGLETNHFYDITKETLCSYR